jgi:cell division protein FtsQ
VRRSLWLLAIIAIVGAAVWLVQSPLLSVATIDIRGTARQEVRDVLATAGVEEGRPWILLRTSRAADDLEALSWIRTAEVRRIFPDSVEVEVEERVGVAWLSLAGRYGLVDAEGVVIETAPTPTAAGPIVRIPAPQPEVGEQVEDPAVRAALAFVVALDGSAAGLEFRLEGEEIWAMMSGHQLRLGRGVDMAAKAAALLALLEDGVAEGAEINLIAPTRPAVTPTTNPPAEVEG